MPQMASCRCNPQGGWALRAMATLGLLDDASRIGVVGPLCPRPQDPRARPITLFTTAC